MKIINLEQGTAEWLEWRSNGIGASDISIIMKVHPKKSPLMLFNEMSGYNKLESQNRAMEYGRQEEPKARAWIEENFKVNLKNICIEDDEHSFMQASLDGLDEDEKFLVEIKCPYSARSLNELEDGQIPDMYLYQLQWQLALCGYDKGYLAVWNGSRCVLHHVPANSPLHLEMKKEVADFWNKFRRGISPSPMNLDFTDISQSHPDLEEKVNAYKGALVARASAERLLKELKPQIEAVGGEHNFLLHGLKMTLCSGNSSYDFKAMEDDGIDLSKYKKTGRSYHRASLVK